MATQDSLETEEVLETQDSRETAAPPLLEHARSLRFESLVELLQAQRRLAPAVGGQGPFQDEAVRFSHDPSLGFSAGDISGVEPPERDGQPTVVRTTFLGLTGIASPLPGYFLDEALDDHGEGRNAFLDLFHHRLLSVFFRAQQSGKPDRILQEDLKDNLSDLLLSIAGLDLESLRAAGMTASTVARIVPIALHGGRDADTLQRVLEIALERQRDAGRFSVKSLTGGDTELDPSQWTRLGINSILGEGGQPLGTWVQSPAVAFEVHCGPLSPFALAQLQSPTALRILRSCVDSITGLALDYSLVLHPDPSIVQSCRLSSFDGSSLGMDAYLGQTSSQPTRIDHAIIAGQSEGESHAH